MHCSRWRHVALCLVGAFGVGGGMSACGWNPTRPFERNAPAVDQAIASLDAGEAGVAAELLESYLQTGACTDGQIGVPDRTRELSSASFDLGLALFHVAEKFGRRFGEEEDVVFDGGPTADQLTQGQLRGDQVECAVRVLRAVASAPNLSVDLFARARYLEGNLEFLHRNYSAAVTAYDEALKLVPGVPPDAGDAIGRDAAWNRAIALRRIEEEKQRDAGKDSEPDRTAPDAGSPDAGQDGPGESGAGDGASKGGPETGGGGPEGGSDAGQDAPSPHNEDSRPDAAGPDGASQPPPQSPSQDDRMLDMLEAAPTVQLQDARNRASRRRARGMIDK